ncbi:syntaxin-like protein, partial [Dinothrombium tinctorium]
VLDSFAKARTQFERWNELKVEFYANGSNREEFEWLTTELRNGLRSIEWDLEDLEETIGIVESNPKKFKLDENEIAQRRLFIKKTKEEVVSLQEKLADFKGSNKEKRTMSTIISNPALNFGNSLSSGAKYTRLQNETESPNRNLANESVINVEDKKDELANGSPDIGKNKINENVNKLRTISDRINREIDEQAVMLDGVGHEVQIQDSKLDTTLRKVCKVLPLPA